MAKPGEARALRPAITLIKKTGANPLLSKRIFLDEREKVCSDGSQCLMAHGTATRATAETAAELARHIMACGSDQAIALGYLREGLPSPAVISTPRKLKDFPGAISRSRENIDYRAGTPAWAMLDFDTKGMPAHIAARIEADGGMWPSLLAVAPGLSKAARVSRASTSSNLYRTDTGAQVEAGGGEHHYVLVRDGADVERFLRDLHNRCWEQGFGWHVIGRAGQLLERSPVDRTVAYGERLCFEGAPIVEPPLAQDTAKRSPLAVEGEAIDTELVVPRLTEYERHRVADAKAASEAALGKEAAEVRSQHDRALAENLSARSGMPMVSALRLVSAGHRGILLPFFDLDFDHLGTTPVAEVLADPDRFIGETLADPLEGAGYGRCKAKVMRAHDGGLLVHSFAHGRTMYWLRHDARSAKAAVAQAPAGAKIDHAMAVLAMTELEADELADFAAAAATAAGIGVRAISARITKERKERDQARGRAAAALSDDGRIVRPRPEPDGELTPTVTFLDDLLASDAREEPPMRDASGNLVEVRVREPWDMHVLTSDGVNIDATASDEEEAMKAPAEPSLAQLTSIGVEMLCETYVHWRVVRPNNRYFGALPRPFIDALMQFSLSAIPVVRAINTAPLVSMSGRVIDGAGLDRNTGLVHRIDPVLRACLPANPPTEQDVRAALSFLLHDWLVDVRADKVGKFIATMLAMTLVERPLLAERPAFFVTAPQRGGGKTTLVNMITTAALGRRAAAAAWSDNAEERKKALFSYLRQGVASISWDNIARGASISCPHIEAALTSAEVSDRVLGVSRIETVPSTTVQIFTGNSILPRGDMASRSLILGIEVDRPDPENRAFAHADPLAWTRRNRPKIMRALYTLLIAGALNRPQHQESKTRFKAWWTMIGWPMEYAASLLGITLDCAELMRAGEVGDEEASAASAALIALKDIWGVHSFTSKDVAQALAVEPRHDTLFTPNGVEEAAKARAETITEALGELAGRRLDRPTAHKVGKLFQKRLVDRPAWLADGLTVATLRRAAGHAENRYRVELSSPGHQPRARGEGKFVASGAGPEHSRHSPLSPIGKDTPDAGKGNEGNEGNVSNGTRQPDTTDSLHRDGPSDNGCGGAADQSPREVGEEETRVAERAASGEYEGGLYRASAERLAAEQLGQH